MKAAHLFVSAVPACVSAPRDVIALILRRNSSPIMLACVLDRRFRCLCQESNRAASFRRSFGLFLVSCAAVGHSRSITLLFSRHVICLPVQYAVYRPWKSRHKPISSTSSIASSISSSSAALCQLGSFTPIVIITINVYIPHRPMSRHGADGEERGGEGEEEYNFPLV